MNELPPLLLLLLLRGTDAGPAGLAERDRGRTCRCCLGIAVDNAAVVSSKFEASLLRVEREADGEKEERRRDPAGEAAAVVR